MRRCAIWYFSPALVLDQFKTCVMPALEYGVSMWGAGQYNLPLWKKVEDFWRYIARCILGVHQRAPNGGVYGELGWFPFELRAARQATSMFVRITQSSDSSLLRKAMYVQRALCLANKPCWLGIYKSTLCRSTFGADIWNQWWNTPDFVCDCVIRRHPVDISHGSFASDPQASTTWEDGVEEATKAMFISTWKADLSRIHAKKGEGGNKLRTYNLFKSSFAYEKYLDCVDNRDKRVLLTKFRIGICPLRIETGRYENVGDRKCIPANERTCLVCNSGDIEDEFHFLLKCPEYAARRLHMLNVYKGISNVTDDQIMGMSNDRSQLFASIMSSKDKMVICSVADYLWEAYMMREHVLLDRNR